LFLAGHPPLPSELRSADLPHKGEVGLIGQ